MNIYLTTESENKLKTIFTNIKSFYVLDILSFINSFKLDLTKLSNVYYVNLELMNTIKNTSKLKKYQGIIYINKNLNPVLLLSLKQNLKTIKTIRKFILFDNATLPKHKELYNFCEEVYFYERFCKNKIVECNGIELDQDGNSTIVLDEMYK